MKIATWNINSLKVRLAQVLSWLNDNPVDVLALQELKLDQDKFPWQEFEAIGYQSFWSGQKTYNGVALLVRSPLKVSNIVCGIPNYTDTQKRIISADVDDKQIICVYCVNGQAPGTDKFLYKLNWFAALNSYIKDELQKQQNLIVLGDFNIAPSDIDVYNPKAWHEKILCSSAEREAFNALLNLGLHDSLRELQPEAVVYSWWDYRQAMFLRKRGLRIDHILISDELFQRSVSCLVDQIPRAWERPSDHAPVILTIS